MQVTIDKFGRVLIPKPLRDEFGLRPGSIIDIEESDHELVLSLHDKETLLECDEGLLIFTGEATGDIENAISQSREQRLKKLS